jgi:hypothetical protein
MRKVEPPRPRDWGPGALPVREQAASMMSMPRIGACAAAWVHSGRGTAKVHLISGIPIVVPALPMQGVVLGFANWQLCECPDDDHAYSQRDAASG